MRRSKTIFVVSDKSLGGGEAVVSGGLHATVLEKVTGTFPLLFVLFLLFSWGDMGVTRGVIRMSPGVVTATSLGAGDPDVTRGLVIRVSPGVAPSLHLSSADSSGASRGSLSGVARTKLASRSVCIQGCQRKR
jgi:hypothetical protein